MITIHSRELSVMVVFAITLHLIWAAIIVLDHSAVNATAVNSLVRYIHPPWFLACVITIASLMAMVGLATHMPWVALLLLPQQILLMMSAAGCVEAIWTAQFADGVIRSRAFLAADQIYSILAAIGHTIAITMHAIRISKIQDGR